MLDIFIQLLNSCNQDYIITEVDEITVVYFAGSIAEFDKGYRLFGIFDIDQYFNSIEYSSIV